MASNLEIKMYKINKLKALKQNKTNNDVKWIKNEMGSEIRFFLIDAAYWNFFKNSIYNVE